MEALPRELMNRGFLIYQYETHPPMGSSMTRPKFVLKKVETPHDQRSLIDEYFATFDEALDEAKELIDWKSKKTVTARSAEHGWMLELMYRHKGLGSKFVDLGEMGPSTYEVALADAKLRAVAHIDGFLNEDDIEGWDVRVRPCHKNSVTRKNGFPSREQVYERLKDHSRELQGG